MDEILANKKAREIEVNELIEVSKEKELPLLGNDINWGNQIINKGRSFESLTVKLLSSMLYYAECDELVQKYLDIKDNKERMRYGIRLEKLGLKSLLKYINSSKNKILYAENKKIIKSMYRVELMLKIWNDSIDQLSLVNFIKNLNDKALRNKITNEEYIYTYQISSKYSLNTKIIQPKFEPKDILYLFFKFKGKDEYTFGPIFDGVDIKSIKINNIYKKALSAVNSKKLDNICEISVLISKMMYKEFTGKNEENLTDNFDELLAFFSNEINNFNPNQSLIKKEFKALIKYNEIVQIF